MKNLFLRSVVVAAIGMSAAAHAADMPVKAPITPPPPIERWTFSLTPYLWATSLNGLTTVRGRTIDVDASFIDIVEHTEIPKNLFQLAALGEARYGRAHRPHLHESRTRCEYHTLSRYRCHRRYGWCLGRTDRQNVHRRAGPRKKFDHLLPSIDPTYPDRSAQI